MSLSTQHLVCLPFAIYGKCPLNRVLGKGKKGETPGYLIVFGLKLTFEPPLNDFLKK